MTPELWKRLNPIFNEAIERPSHDRIAFIAEVCGDDLELRAELLAVLDAHEMHSSVTGPLAPELANIVRSGGPEVVAPGDLVLGRFQIVRQLGSGGMGDVYEAIDRDLQQTVALKVIRPEIARDEQILARFRREVQLARRLGGPNLCRIHELFVFKGKTGCVEGAFLTMELLDGTSLADRLKDGPLPWREAQAIALDICSGLAAMHNAGIVHRDLKSRNVMLAKRGGAQRAVLMDFGLAHELSETKATSETGLTIPGMVLGTPEYMAPEQFEGKAVTPASDMYAAGIVLYELVTGKHPFASTSPIGAAVLRGKNPLPASTLIPKLPHRWDIAIGKCLEYDAARRCQSAEELASILTAPGVGLRIVGNRWLASLFFAGSSLVRTESVNFNDDLKICFEEGGAFFRDGVGDTFTGKLPQGAVSQGLSVAFTAPSARLDMIWVFVGSSNLASGILQIKPGNNCADASTPPCP